MMAPEKIHRHRGGLSAELSRLLTEAGLPILVPALKPRA